MSSKSESSAKSVFQRWVGISRITAEKDINLNQYLDGGSSGLTPSTRRYGVNLNLTF
ncbi:MAG: hypothetical protein IPH28_23590 [Cytophagaceae bacterium]|nr:hypothetical protein [Cytophagaceae bacterium]